MLGAVQKNSNLHRKLIKHDRIGINNFFTINIHENNEFFIGYLVTI